MSFNRIVRGMIVGLVSAAALVLSGCAMDAGDAGAPEEGEVGQAAEAIGTECAAASPTRTFVGAIDYTSPQTYSTANCYKAVVLDVTDCRAGFPPPPGGASFQTTLAWEDALPTTQAACEQLWVRGDLFEVVNGIPVYKGYKESFGAWDIYNQGDGCARPWVGFGGQMAAGKNYRIAATARTDNTSAAPTRRLSVESWWYPL